ncbi:MAG: hypothetical protein VX341_07620 [Bdellovibrionota bacterium]|nr:hypothetical protein [Bdellovibrionota bacterium]|tara:strand:- start:580 stop:741 length:162 start_codon:yes stop_codon:yes gene_type:complete
MELKSLTNIQEPKEALITDSFPLMLMKVSLVVMLLMIFVVKPFASFVATYFTH